LLGGISNTTIWKWIAEGITLSGQMRQRIAKFDSDDVPAAKRRQVIIQAYRNT
jgi:hypothetical protein